MTRMNYEKCNKPPRSSYDTNDEHVRIPPARFRADPATPKQIDYLQALLAKHGQPPLDKFETIKMSRSRVSFMIKELLAT